MELVRAGISSRTGAALVNALLIDLKEFFIDVIQDNFNVILADKCKIDRAMKKVRKECETKSKETRGESLVCIGVDGKIDSTKSFEGKNLNRTTKREHHIVFTDETKRPGTYITHSTLKGKAEAEAHTMFLMNLDPWTLLKPFCSTTLRQILVELMVWLPVWKENWKEAFIFLAALFTAMKYP